MKLILTAFLTITCGVILASSPLAASDDAPLSIKTLLSSPTSPSELRTIPTTPEEGAAHGGFSDASKSSSAADEEIDSYIFIVDDQKTTHSFFDRYLKSTKHKKFNFMTGCDFINFDWVTLPEDAVVTIFLDHDMPSKTGSDAVTELHDIWDNLKKTKNISFRVIPISSDNTLFYGQVEFMKLYGHWFIEEANSLSKIELLKEHFLRYIKNHGDEVRFARIARRDAAGE